jgi:hypothetical protein
MKRRLLLFARYHRSSPRQLKRSPRPSVRLSRALGFAIFSNTPLSSAAGPRLGSIPPLLLRSAVNTRSRRSSSVSADIYIRISSLPIQMVTDNLILFMLSCFACACLVLMPKRHDIQAAPRTISCSTTVNSQKPPCISAQLLEGREKNVPMGCHYRDRRHCECRYHRGCFSRKRIPEDRFE